MNVAGTPVPKLVAGSKGNAGVCFPQLTFLPSVVAPQIPQRVHCA